MPEIRGDTLDVSAEEERYLRRTFQRFALPYLAAFLAVAVLMSAAGGMVTASRGEGAGDEVNSLVAEAASLREALAALREELREQDADAAARLEALEGGLAKLRTSAAGGSTAELGSRLDNAHQRINALEARLEQIEASRTAAAPPPSPAPSSPPPTSAWPSSGAGLP